VGYDLLAAAFFVLLTPIVLVGFVAFWVVTARDREEHGAFLEGYARARGLAFLPAAGEWPNRTSAAVEWSEGGVRMRLSVLGREARAKTRLTIRPRSTLLGALVATPDVETRAFVRTLRERPAKFGERILDERVTRALLGFCQRDRVVLTYRRGRVLLDWPGRETNDARLDQARLVASEIARAVDAKFRAAAAARAA